MTEVTPKSILFIHPDGSPIDSLMREHWRLNWRNDLVQATEFSTQNTLGEKTLLDYAAIVVVDEALKIPSVLNAVREYAAESDGYVIIPTTKPLHVPKIQKAYKIQVSNTRTASGMSAKIMNKLRDFSIPIGGA